MSDTDQAKKVAVLTVFTSETAKGNAAAVVITPERLSFAERTKLGVELADPATATAFISHPTLLQQLDGADFTSPRPTISWTRYNGQSLPLCGHGTAAGVQYLLQNVLKTTSNVTFDYYFGDTAETETVRGTILTLTEGVKFGVDLPAAHPGRDLTPEEQTEVESVFCSATGLSPKDIVATVASISGYNGPGLTTNVTIQIKPSVDLGALKLDYDKLSTLRFRGIFVTSEWPEHRADSAFRSRIFFPKTGLLEDNACGSAHTFLVPWWISTYPAKFESYAEKTEDGGPRYRVPADQPSPLGAKMEIVWDGKWRDEGGRCILMGEGIVLKEF